MSVEKQEINLIDYVKKELTFNGKRALLMLATLIVVLLIFTVSDIVKVFNVSRQSKALIAAVDKKEQSLKSLTVRDNQSDYIIGILPDNIVLNNAGFYHEFEALSRFSINDLWITNIHINEHGDFVKISGGTLESSHVNELLKHIGEEPAFKGKSFPGIKVTKGSLPKLAYNKRKKADKLNIPVFYDFTIQTTAINSGTRGAS